MPGTPQAHADGSGGRRSSRTQSEGVSPRAPIGEVAEPPPVEKQASGHDETIEHEGGSDPKRYDGDWPPKWPITREVPYDRAATTRSSRLRLHGRPATERACGGAGSDITAWARVMHHTRARDRAAVRTQARGSMAMLARTVLGRCGPVVVARLLRRLRGHGSTDTSASAAEPVRFRARRVPCFQGNES